MSFYRLWKSSRWRVVEDKAGGKKSETTVIRTETIYGGGELTKKNIHKYMKQHGLENIRVAENIERKVY